MDEFGIHGSFQPATYSPFVTGFGGVFDNTPTPTASTSQTQTSTKSSGVGGWLGDVVGGALNTGLNYLNGLAQLDFFGKAKDAGLVPGQQTVATTAQHTAAGTVDADGKGLPDWAVPAGIVAGGLLLLALLWPKG